MTKTGRPKVDGEESILKVAVVSDLHAYETHDDSGEGAPSYLCTSAPEDQASQHPISGLLHLIHEKTLKADLLICCGDMGDKARPGPMKYVWERLQTLRSALDATMLAATAGNHDVDSRYIYNEFDAKGCLQALLPTFPLIDVEQSNKFWARNYVILTEPKCRLVILNSSAYHGFRAGEFEHGRVALRTVEALKAELLSLEASQPRDVNILVCHHHPHKHLDIEIKDYSVMEGAEKLLAVLESGNCGNWIVIHGHKHHPRICYAAGGSSSPVIFSAGSLCAILHPAIQSNARNQFYVITFPLTKLKTLGLGLAGTFESWDWLSGHGWVRAGIRSGLPAFGGFGNREDVTAMSSSVASVVTESTEPWLEWSQIMIQFPRLEFLLPVNLETLIQRLKSSHRLTITRDDDGRPVQVGKML
jgi:calcineurin-like phosphoesterase family protein